MPMIASKKKTGRPTMRHSNNKGKDRLVKMSVQVPSRLRAEGFAAARFYDFTMTEYFNRQLQDLVRAMRADMAAQQKLTEKKMEVESARAQP